MDRVEYLIKMGNTFLKMAEVEKEAQTKTKSVKEQMKEDEPKKTLDQAEAEAKKTYKDQKQHQLYEALENLKPEKEIEMMKKGAVEMEKLATELEKDPNFELKKQAFVLGYLKGMEKFAGEVSLFYEKQMDPGFNWRDRFKFDKVRPAELNYLESIVEVDLLKVDPSKIQTENPKDLDTKEEKFFSTKEKIPVQPKISASLEKEEAMLDQVLQEE